MGLRGGIDLGGTKIQAVVIDDVHTVLGKARCATPTKGGPPDVAAAIASARRDAAEAAGVTTSELAHVGVGSPGEIGSASGTVTSARNLPGWEGSYPLAAVLHDDLGVLDRARSAIRDRLGMPTLAPHQVRRPRRR